LVQIFSRLIPVDENIAETFSSLLRKYSRQGLRNGDALVAATAWSRNYRCSQETLNIWFISEITLVDPLKERKRD
jgi:predicted nucleic acid-binding protein